MEVQITKNIRIISDDHNYILQEKHKLKVDSYFGKKKGDLTGWKDYGYYQDIEHLMEDAVKLKIWRSEAKTTEEVHSIIKSFKTPKSLRSASDRA